ncbi:MAG: hypothetical protein ACRDQG_11320 [Pseudonocardiaceae bacterium]
MFRTGLVVAKLKLAKGLAALEAGELAARSGPISPHLQRVLEVGFNIPGDLPRVELLSALEILVTGLTRIRAGLNDPVTLVSSARMRAYGVIDKPADCSGWVPAGLTDGIDRSAPVTGNKDLKTMSGDIHMQTGALATPSFVGDTLIHEGAHKFLGAVDYSYVGVQGSVARGLATKTDKAMEDDDTLDEAAARQQVKASLSNWAYATVVLKLVSKAIDPVFPMMRRGVGAKPTDSPAVLEARKVWKVVRTYGLPGATPPMPTKLGEDITQLLTLDGLPSGAKSELRKIVAGKEAYLAENGNELGVKGHEVLFALSTAFLLKNADSWTELALTAGG